MSLPSSSLLQPGVVPVCTALGDVLIFTFGEALSNLSLSCVLSCEGTSLPSTTPTSTKITDVVIVKELVFVLLENGSVCILTCHLIVAFHSAFECDQCICSWGLRPHGHKFD